MPFEVGLDIPLYYKLYPTNVPLSIRFISIYIFLIATVIKDAEKHSITIFAGFYLFYIFVDYVDYSWSLTYNFQIVRLDMPFYHILSHFIPVMFHSQSHFFV